jgi:hypothetical protein
MVVLGTLQNCIAVLFSVLLLMTSCSGKDCTEEGLAGLTIRIQDATTAEPICDARLEVRYSNGELVQSKSDHPCVFVGAFEQADTYRISVSRAGYVPEDLSETVTEGECHVNPKAILVELEPTP